MNIETQQQLIGSAAAAGGSIGGGIGLYLGGPIPAAILGTGGFYTGLFLGKIACIIESSIAEKNQAIGEACSPLLDKGNQTLNKANEVIDRAGECVKIFNSIASNAIGVIPTITGIGAWFFVKMFGPTCRSEADCWGQDMLQNGSLAVAFIGFAVITICSLKSLR